MNDSLCNISFFESFVNSKLKNFFIILNKFVFSSSVLSIAFSMQKNGVNILRFAE